MSILVLGTVALDTVKTPHGLRNYMLGGSAVHFSMSARLFTHVNLVASVGEDFPSEHLDFLSGKGINLDSLLTTAGVTFKWSGEYTGDMNTALTLKTELGVLSEFRPVVRSGQRGIRNIFLANVDPEIQNRLLGRMHSARLVGLDSMNYWINNKRRSLLKLLKKVDIYVANDREARDLSGEEHLLSAAKSLHRMGPRIVLIKKGEHGVMLYGKDIFFSLPAYPVEKVVDPTGAGDTFAGGFMGYLAGCGRTDKSALKKAVVYGTVCASFNVEGFGLERSGRLTLADIRGRMKRFKEISAF